MRIDKELMEIWPNEVCDSVDDLIRPMSGLLTTLIVSLLQCVKVDTLGTPCEEDLDRAYYPFEQFYLNYHAKFLYSLFNTFIS